MSVANGIATMTNERITTDQFNGYVPDEVMDIASLGEGLALAKSGIVHFTHAFATKLLEMKECEWERGLRDSHVSFLIGEWKKGMFRHEIANLATCECEEAGFNVFRINGQHCCWARLELPEKEFPPQPIKLLHYKAKTVEDMRRLYASFDRGAVRSRGNIIQSYLGGASEFAEFPINMVKLFATGTLMWKWEDRHLQRQHPADDVAFVMKTELKDVIRAALAICVETPSADAIAWMKRGSVAAAMIETCSKTVKDSAEFWSTIKNGLGFTSVDDPRRRLREQLMSTGIYNIGSGAIQDKAGKKKTDQETMYRWCITAWNAWRAGETLKVFRTPHKRQRAK